MTTHGFSEGESGLRLHWDAYRYAQELDCNVWEFALEWPFLEKSGLTINHLRWLVIKGLADHGRDVTRRHDTSRQFRRGGPLLSHKRTCLVLTDKGAAEITDLMQNGAATSSSTEHHPESYATKNATVILECERPKWDYDRQELRFDGTLVKQFRLPSPNQETVLAAFEEERWPPRIDDPLPPRTDIDAKKRLHDTIKSLNRRQKHRRIRFMGDGRGIGVRWEPITSQK
jgi:hypothetical protein